MVWYGELQLFPQLLASCRPSYLTERFWTLTRSQKDFIAHLRCPIFVCRGLLELFDFILLHSSDYLIAILPYMPASQSLFLSLYIDSFFHDVGSKDQLCLEQAGNSDDIFLSPCCFRSTNPIFGFVVSRFRISAYCRILLITKEEKCCKINFSKISGYSKVKITEEDFNLVQ